MSYTDTLISTDGDGTEHWERYLVPNSHADKLVVAVQSGTYYLNYDDNSGPGGPIVFPDTRWYPQAYTQTQPDTFSADQVVSLVCYYDALPVSDLPDGAAVDSYGFDYDTGSVTVDTPTDPVELAIDLYTGDRPAAVGDTGSIEVLTDVPGTEVCARNDLRSFDTGPRYTIADPARTVLLGDLSPFAVRFLIQPSTVAFQDFFVGPTHVKATGYGHVPIFTSLYLGLYDPRFVISYSIAPAATTTPPIAIPRFHTAKLVRAATRQPVLTFTMSTPARLERE